MTFQLNDGGRAAAGYTRPARDCFVRALAIATGWRYQAVYDMVNEKCSTERRGKKWKTGSSSRDGIYQSTARRIMLELGFTWVPTMFIGQGCKVHLRAAELPAGGIVCRVSKHYVAVIDGVVNDSYDSSRGGDRCVYGYWIIN